MQNIRNYIIFILLLAVNQTKAQETLSLDSIIAIIESENQELKYFDQKILSQNAKIEGANAWMAPMVGAGTFMTPYPGQNVMAGDKGALMITAEQSIPNSAKIKANQAYLSSLSTITKNQKDYTFNSLKALAKDNYYDILINTKKVKLLEENLQILNNLKKLGEIRYEYNKGSLSQIYKLESKTYELNNLIEEANRDIEIAKINLNILMNKNPEQSLKINANKNLNLKNLNLVNSSYLLSNNSELKMTVNEIKSIEKQANSISAEARPEFKIRLDHMSPLSNLMPQQYSAMAMVSIPIAPWSSKSYKANLKANKLEAQALEQKKNALLNSTYGMLKSLQERIASSENLIKNFEHKIIPVNKKNLDVLLLNYQENKEELPMVLEGWEMLNMAQLNYLTELGNYYKSIIAYEKSIEQ